MRVSPNQLVVTAQVHASPARVWRLLTDPDSLTRWFTFCSPVSAKRFEFTFNDDGSPPHTKTAVVTECLPGTSMTVRWLDPGYTPSCVTVLIAAGPEGTADIELTHSDVPPSLSDAYRAGWADYIDALERVAHDGR